ncbi:MAG: diacylglycerol kinase family protein [Candidatus Pristimantibacillus sp.]
MARFMRSLSYAISGIAYAVRTQRHIRFHLIAAILVCGISAILALTRLEWAILLLTIAFVIAAEMINTAIEQVVDLASPNLHPLAKAAKDVAAGAVLIAAMMAVIIGLLILGPPLWHLLSHI